MWSGISEQEIYNVKQAQDMAFRLSGMTDLVDRCKTCVIECDGEKRFGFLTPHIGKSLQSLMRDEKSMTREKARKIYRGGLELAYTLLTKYGYYFDDSNFGNVIVRGDLNDLWEVTLIDFDPFLVVSRPYSFDDRVESVLAGFRIKGEMGGLGVVELETDMLQWQYPQIL